MWIVSKRVSGRWIHNNLYWKFSKNKYFHYNSKERNNNKWFNKKYEYFDLLNTYYYGIILERRSLLKRWILSSKISQIKTKIKDNSAFYLENNKDFFKRKKKWKDNILEQELIRYNNKENFELPFLKWGRSSKSDLWDALTYIDQTFFVMNIDNATVKDTIPWAFFLRNCVYLINSWANWLKKTSFFELEMRKRSCFIY